MKRISSIAIVAAAILTTALAGGANAASYGSMNAGLVASSAAGSGAFGGQPGWAQRVFTPKR